MKGLQMSVVRQRPKHRGALNTSDLTVGRVVRRHRGLNGQHCDLRITSEPFTLDPHPDYPDRELRRAVMVFDYELGSEQLVMLTDIGVEAYDNGMWNEYNYVTALPSRWHSLVQGAWSRIRSIVDLRRSLQIM